MQKPRITDDYPWLRYVIAAFVGLVLVVAYCWWKELFKTGDAADSIRILSNAFLIVGVPELGLGLLSFIKKEGVFDGLFYSFYSMRMMRAKRQMNEPVGAKTYYDYKQETKAKRRIAWHLIIVGGAFLFIAVVLTVVFGIIAP